MYMYICISKDHSMIETCRLKNVIFFQTIHKILQLEFASHCIILNKMGNTKLNV